MTNMTGDNNERGGYLIKIGMIVRDLKRPVSKGAAIVVGPAKRVGQFRICRWRGGQLHWSLPMTVAQDQIAPIDDWTAVPLTEAKRLAAAAFERSCLVRAMASAQGSVVDAARSVGVDRSNFRRLLQRHGLAKMPSRAAASRNARRHKRWPKNRSKRAT